MPEDDRRVVAATKHLETTTADLKRLTELQEVRSAVIPNRIRRAGERRGMAEKRPTRQHHARSGQGRAAKTEQGESITDAVERLRRRGRELKADLARIAASPFPSAHCKQRIRAQIEALAMQGAPSVSRLVELDGPVDFQTQRITSQVRANGGYRRSPKCLTRSHW
jgi:hypothetical protein